MLVAGMRLPCTILLHRPGWADAGAVGLEETVAAPALAFLHVVPQLL